MLGNDKKILTRLIGYSGLALYSLTASSVTAAETTPGTSVIRLAAISVPTVETRQSAQTLLAMANHYRTGEGVQVNHGRAFEYYKRAAHMGSAEAQFQLATMYLESEAISQNEDEALAWLELAVDQGHIDARFTYNYLLSNTHYDGC